VYPNTVLNSRIMFYTFGPRGKLEKVCASSLCGAQMKPINLFVVLLLFASTASAQLEVDRDRFVIELHPGEMTKRSLTLENTGDVPLSDVRVTPVAGEAKDIIELDDLKIDEIEPKDEEEVDIIFRAPLEAKPGTCTGFVYFFDGLHPSLPLLVQFEIVVIEQESYGVSLSIEDDRSASMTVDTDEPAEFEILVRNSGQFRDVIKIDVPPLPNGWTATLYDGEKAVDLPYELPLSPTGVPHELDLEIMGERGGEHQEVYVTAVSLSDPSKNATAKAVVDINLEIRAYNVILDVPEPIIVNRTHKGSITIKLNVEETISVRAVAPPGLIVMPLTQRIEVSDEVDGFGEFSLMATRPGPFNLTFLLKDSNYIPLPKETASTTAIDTSDFAIVTGDDLAHKSMVLSYVEGNENETVPLLLLHEGKLEEEELKALMRMPLSKVIIVGDESTVPLDAEDALAENVEVERISGEDVCETSWLFALAMRSEGPKEVVLAGDDEVEIFGAYQEARRLSSPLVICGSTLSEKSCSVVEDLMNRGLSKVLIWAGVEEEMIQSLEDMGLATEEVAH